MVEGLAKYIFNLYFLLETWNGFDTQNLKVTENISFVFSLPS